VLTKDDVSLLQEAAEWYQQLSQYRVAKCITYLYRNKPQEYFHAIFSERGGIMKTYLKDASGDLRSPINGEICGLFFSANVIHGKPFPRSPYGDTRVLIRAEEVFRLTPNMFFGDFYCMLNNQDTHHVTVVLTKSGSSADQFCNRHLPRLDIYSNPFLYKDNKGHIWVSSAIFVDVFVTEDLNMKNIIRRRVAKIEHSVPTRGLGRTSQGGQMGIKTDDCEKCDMFFVRFLAERPDSYEVY